MKYTNLKIGDIREISIRFGWLFIGFSGVGNVKDISISLIWGESK